MKKRINDKRGFSLAELLVALLITSLAGLIVMGGIGVTTRLFQDVLLHSQAQLVMKEYMSELRSGFLCAEMDSPVAVAVYHEGDDDPATDPVFAHSGYKCAGFYTLLGVPQNIDGKEYGVIVFQPALYDDRVDAQGHVVTLKEAPEGQTMPAPRRLISASLSDNFLASFDYRYVEQSGSNGETEGHFVLWLTVRSNGVLSTGEHVMLSAGGENGIEITPTGK